MATKDQIRGVAKIAAIGATTGLVALSVWAFLSGIGIAHSYYNRDFGNIFMAWSQSDNPSIVKAGITAQDVWMGLLYQSVGLQASGTIVDHGLTAMVLGAAFALVCYYVHRKSKALAQPR